MSKEPTSEEFDPLLALYSESSNNASDVKVFDNLAVFEANLKRNNQKKNINEKLTTSRKSKSFSQRKRIEAEVQNRDLSKLKEMMEQRKKMDEESGVESKEKQVLIQRSKNIVRIFSLLWKAMVDVDETFAMSPRGQVIEHQKKLTVFQLTEALKEIQKKGLEISSLSAPSTKGSRFGIDHLSTTGAMIVKKSTFVAQPERSEASSTAVKRYNWRNPPNEKAQTFSGGKQQLYHRHINNLYVRGDSVVLISLPT